MPSLISTSVVKPWLVLGTRFGVFSSQPSECVWTSMKPGATTSPRASIVRRAADGLAGQWRRSADDRGSPAIRHVGRLAQARRCRR